MKKIAITLLALVAMATPALANPAIIGSFFISSMLSVGAGGILPVASAAAIGLFTLGRRGGRRK